MKRCCFYSNTQKISIKNTIRRTLDRSSCVDMIINKIADTGEIAEDGKKISYLCSIEIHYTYREPRVEHCK